MCSPDSANAPFTRKWKKWIPAASSTTATARDHTACKPSASQEDKSRDSVGCWLPSSKTTSTNSFWASICGTPFSFNIKHCSFRETPERSRQRPQCSATSGTLSARRLKEVLRLCSPGCLPTDCMFSCRAAFTTAGFSLLPCALSTGELLNFATFSVFELKFKKASHGPSSSPAGKLKRRFGLDSQSSEDSRTMTALNSTSLNEQLCRCNTPAQMGNRSGEVQSLMPFLASQFPSSGHDPTTET
mmetsp:Transcript_10856/g.18400  ORF Transcript_10856/g.18400 Transcript_10856/m.18400 type:complete len:244 (+) Transcript_10856:2-733(+)